MSFNGEVRQRLLKQLVDTQLEDEQGLNNALRFLSKWRSVLIQNTVLAKQGTLVQYGPLRGLDFLPQSAEGCHIAKLLGCYEQPLQTHVENAIKQEYPVILNIGCAEGYYAVGMARRMPSARIFAFDLDKNAQDVCRELARKNGVADRVEVAGLFQPQDFAKHAGGKVLVFCDIEGAERDLLDPVVSPALAGMDLIVEAHECLLPGIASLLQSRFAATHVVTVVEDDGQRSLPEMPDWFRNLAHLDQLLAVWEWRSGPTPWLVMKSRKGSDE